MSLALLADSSPLNWNQLLVQFPVVGLVAAAVWWVTRNTEHRYNLFIDRLQSLNDQLRAAVDKQADRLEGLEKRLKVEFDRAAGEVKAAGEAALAAMQARHEAELDRAERAHAAHVRSLSAEIRRLDAMARNRPDTNGG